MSTRLPPGLIGDIANFIIEQAPRPVPQIALAAAIGLVAGITGRAYNVSGAGLNQYVLLVAETGRGKEAIASGIAKLMAAVKASVPSAVDFEGPTEIASPQAILKWLSRTPCIYSIVGEFGMKMKEMNSPHANANTAGLKRILLDLYAKSGHGSVLGAMAYSDRANNTAVIASPSFTFIGESTPETLYENVDEKLISNGLLSRFSVIEYDGLRVPYNKLHYAAKPSDELVRKLAELAAHSQSLQSTGLVCNVSTSAEADKVFDDFNGHCDDEINDRCSGTIGRELWNRAHLKSLKRAALYAIGENYIAPEISLEQAEYATDEVHAETMALIGRFSRGDVGAIENNEALRQSELIRAIRDYCTMPFSSLPKYGIREDMHHAKFIPLGYLQKRLLNAAAFRRAKQGAALAMQTSVKALIDTDVLREISKKEMTEKYGTTMRAFAVSNAAAILDPDDN